MGKIDFFLIGVTAQVVVQLHLAIVQGLPFQSDDETVSDLQHLTQKIQSNTRFSLICRFLYSYFQIKEYTHHRRKHSC